MRHRACSEGHGRAASYLRVNKDSERRAPCAIEPRSKGHGRAASYLRENKDSERRAPRAIELARRAMAEPPPIFVLTKIARKKKIFRGGPRTHVGRKDVMAEKIKESYSALQRCTPCARLRSYQRQAVIKDKRRKPFPFKPMPASCFLPLSPSGKQPLCPADATAPACHHDIIMPEESLWNASGHKLPATFGNRPERKRIRGFFPSALPSRETAFRHIVSPRSRFLSPYPWKRIALRPEQQVPPRTLNFPQLFPPRKNLDGIQQASRPAVGRYKKKLNGILPDPAS